MLSARLRVFQRSSVSTGVKTYERALGAFYLLLGTQPDRLYLSVASWEIAAQGPAQRFIPQPSPATARRNHF